MQLTKNFQLAEFACKDGTPVPDNLIPVVAELAKNLQVLRDDIGEGIHLNSAYRTPAYNKKIGGVKDSQHTKGTAGAGIRFKNGTMILIKAYQFNGSTSYGGQLVYPISFRK